MRRDRNTLLVGASNAFCRIAIGVLVIAVIRRSEMGRMLKTRFSRRRRVGWRFVYQCPRSWSEWQSGFRSGPDRDVQNGECDQTERKGASGRTKQTHSSQPTANRPQGRSRRKNITFAASCVARTTDLSSQFSRAAVSWARIRGGNIVLPIFVLVFEREIGIFDDANGFERPRCIGNGHHAARSLQVFRQTPLIPDI